MVKNEMTQEQLNVVLGNVQASVRRNKEVKPIGKNEPFVTAESGGASSSIPDGIVITIPTFESIEDKMSKMTTSNGRTIYIIPVVGELDENVSAVALYTSQFLKQLMPLKNSEIGDVVEFDEVQSVEKKSPEFYADFKYGCGLNIKTFLNKYAGSTVTITKEQYPVLKYKANPEERLQSGSTIGPDDVSMGTLYSFEWENKVENNVEAE